MQGTKTLYLITFASIFAAALSLQCLECSEKSSKEANKCSVNSTSFRESEETTARCRIWSLNSEPVLRSLVSETLCTNATLTQNMENDIDGKFPGSGPANAQCCKWDLCNFNVTLAALSEAPQVNMESSTERNSAYITILSSLVLVSCIKIKFIL